MRIDKGSLTLELDELNRNTFADNVLVAELRYNGVNLDVGTGLNIALSLEDVKQLHSFLGDVLNKLG